MHASIRLLAPLVATALAGCAASTPAFDASFGQSVAALRDAQVRDPGATQANRDRMPDGLDGRASREAVERYYRSFSEPPRQTNVFTIGVGGDSGGAAAGVR